MYCHTEVEVADQTFYLTQSQYTDTGPTSPRADPITTGACQGNHWSANVKSLEWLDPEKKSRLQRDSNPGSSALEADALTTRPTKQFYWQNMKFTTLMHVHRGRLHAKYVQVSESYHYTPSCSTVQKVYNKGLKEEWGFNYEERNWRQWMTRKHWQILKQCHVLRGVSTEKKYDETNHLYSETAEHLENPSYPVCVVSLYFRLACKLH